MLNTEKTMRPYRDSNALQQYHQVGVQAKVAEATPHELVQMLLDGVSGYFGPALAR